MSSPFDEKIKELENSLGKATSEIPLGKGGIEAYKQYIFMSIPVVAALFLYYFKFGCVTTEDDDGQKKIDKAKFVKWVAILTAVIAGGGYYYFYIRQ